MTVAYACNCIYVCVNFETKFFSAEENVRLG